MMKQLVMAHIPGLIDLKVVLSLLQLDGYAALTGGCIRDAYHGHPHKDIDIAVFGAPSDEARDRLLSGLEELGYKSAFTGERGDNINTNIEASEADAERIDDVVALITPSGERLDLLMYTRSYLTLAHVLESHDHTISQFAAVYSPLDEEAYAFYLHQAGMGRCYQVRDNVGDARIAHIKRACERLSWTYFPKNKPVPSFDWLKTARLHELGVN